MSGPSLNSVERFQLKGEALHEAYKLVWRDIYRHKMRYEPAEYANEMHLSPEDVQEFELQFNREAESSQDCRYIVVGLPHDQFVADPKWYYDRAKKASHKTYVGKCWYALEMGEEGTHPHFNFFFYKTVKWLARSRLIAEFANTFQVEKNFVKVKSMGEHGEDSIMGYISKEGGEVLTNFKGLKKPKNKKIV